MIQISNTDAVIIARTLRMLGTKGYENSPKDLKWQNAIRNAKLMARKLTRHLERSSIDT